MKMKNIRHVHYSAELSVILTSSREMGAEEGLRKTGALSLTSVTVMSIETILVSLRGEELVASATL